MVNPLSSAATQPAVTVRGKTSWDMFTEALRPSIEETSLHNWLVLVGLAIAGLIAGQLVGKILRALAGRARRRQKEFRAKAIESAASPIALLIMVGSVAAGAGGIAMSPEVRSFAVRVLMLLNVIVFGWFLFNTIDLLDLLIRRHLQRVAQGTFHQTIPMIRRLVRLVLVIVLGLFTVANVFDGNVSSLLAGLGIAGLAVTLSAQDTIKNFFGSITILLDRPFAIGDYIVIDGYEGTVEEVGFRSTRLRRNEGSLVTIPNSKAVEQSISNFSRRDSIRRTVDLLIPYDTAVEKLRELPDKVCAILTAADVHEKLANHYEPQVRFVEQKPDYLAFRIIYWFESTDRHTFYKHAQQVNFGLLEYFREAQISAKLSDIDVMVGKR